MWSKYENGGYYFFKSDVYKFDANFIEKFLKLLLRKVYFVILLKNSKYVMVKMAEQNNMSDFMTWRAIGKLESGQAQNFVAQACHVSQRVISRLWESLSVSKNKVAIISNSKGQSARRL